MKRAVVISTACCLLLFIFVRMRPAHHFSHRSLPTRRRLTGDAGEQYDWTAALERMHTVLRRSIENQYDSSKSEAAIKSALHDRSHTVWIIAGKIYVDHSFLGTMKNELHLRLLRAVLSGGKRFLQNEGKSKKKANTTKTHRLLNTIFSSQATERTGVLMYSYEASATGRSKCDLSLPLLVIAKKFHQQCGIMIPNPYFDIYGEWRKDYTRLLALADKKQWETRNPRVFWRGKIRGHDSKEDCGRDAGNFARISATGLTLQFPKRFDVRPTDCETRHGKQCDSIFEVNEIEHKVAARNCRSIRGHFESHAKFTDFKFVLDLPGSTSGSYSRNLNHLWLLGGVVMTWTGPLLDDQGAMQWYTPALQDKHTHLVVDKHSASPIVEDVASNTSSRQYLITNARNVATKLLCPNCLVLYMLTVFQYLIEHFATSLSGTRNDVLTQNATTKLLDQEDDGYLDLLNSAQPEVQARRSALLSASKCSSLKLVQVIGDHVAHHNRNTPPWKVPTRPVRGISPCELLNSGGKQGPPSVTVGSSRRHHSPHSASS